MVFYLFKRFFLFFLFPIVVCSAETVNDQHIQVALRKMGDEILLSVGDSYSRVLPITQEGKKYKIQFENEFQFNGDDLIVVVQKIVEETQIAKSYFLEVNTCDSNFTVYSFENRPLNEESMFPCKTRLQEKKCYNIFFTIVEPGNPTIIKGENNTNTSNSYYAVVFALLIIVIGLVVFFYKRKSTKNVESNFITIGQYQFNQHEMKLYYQAQPIELSGKEVELLLLLYTNKNKVVEREQILKQVWGNEGDYVGRTLDVFVSKLRKKFKDDPNIKIINIRGVGYRFMMD